MIHTFAALELRIKLSECYKSTSYAIKNINFNKHKNTLFIYHGEKLQTNLIETLHIDIQT